MKRGESMAFILEVILVFLMAFTMLSIGYFLGRMSK